MKKIAVFCVGCLSIVVLNASAEPAVVIKVDDSSGFLFDGDGNATPVICDSLDVETNSQTGVINFSCRGKGLPNSSGRAVKYDIYNNPLYWQDGIIIPCAFLNSDGMLELSDNWTESISASGNFVFRCQVKND
jgi:hypothetical protein